MLFHYYLKKEKKWTILIDDAFLCIPNLLIFEYLKLGYKDSHIRIDGGHYYLMRDSSAIDVFIPSGFKEG
jgi:hypothetical protein